MISNQTMCRRLCLCFALVFVLGIHSAVSQEPEHQSSLSETWLLMQIIPNLTWTGLPDQTHFAFEWEAAPVIFSFGMNRLDPRWHFFKVTQPERFAGSIEFTVSTQLYTSKVGSSHWGFSGQLVTHLPLVERGEYLGLSLGAARYSIAGAPSDYLIVGFSTLFGFLHYNIKYSPADIIWMHSIEFRFF